MGRSRKIGTAQKFALALLSALLLAACTPASREARDEVNPPPPEKDHVAVRRVVDGLIAAGNAGDLEAILSYFADDAELLPPNSVPVRGIQTIRLRYEQILAESVLELRAVSRETRVEGDWAFDRGAIKGEIFLKNNGGEADLNSPSRTVNDKYMMIFRRDTGGGWKITRLIWNSSDPLPRPAPLPPPERN